MQPTANDKAPKNGKPTKPEKPATPKNVKKKKPEPGSHEAVMAAMRYAKKNPIKFVWEN